MQVLLLLFLSGARSQKKICCEYVCLYHERNGQNLRPCNGNIMHQLNAKILCLTVNIMPQNPELLKCEDEKHPGHNLFASLACHPFF